MKNPAFASFLPVRKWRSEVGRRRAHGQVPGERGTYGYFVSGTQPFLSEVHFHFRLPREVRPLQPCSALGSQAFILGWPTPRLGSR